MVLFVRVKVGCDNNSVRKFLSCKRKLCSLTLWDIGKLNKNFATTRNFNSWNWPWNFDWPDRSILAAFITDVFINKLVRCDHIKKTDNFGCLTRTINILNSGDLKLNRNNIYWCSIFCSNACTLHNQFFFRPTASRSVRLWLDQWFHTHRTHRRHSLSKVQLLNPWPDWMHAVVQMRWVVPWLDPHWDSLPGLKRKFCVRSLEQQCLPLLERWHQDFRTCQALTGYRAAGEASNSGFFKVDSIKGPGLSSLVNGAEFQKCKVLVQIDLSSQDGERWDVRQFLVRQLKWI